MTHKKASLFASPILALWFSLLGSNLSGQKAMSLPEMVSQALKANYDLRIVRNEQRQAENNNSIGNAGMLPVADLFAEQAYTINNSQQQFVTGDTQNAQAARNEASTARLSVNWTVFDGFAMFARKERLEKLALLGKTNTRYYVEQTAADLAKAYYQLKQERNLLASYRKTLEVSSARLSLQKKSREIGSATALDVQRAEVDRNTDSSMVLSQVAQIQSLKININVMMNRSLQEDFAPVDSILLTNSLQLDEILEAARAQNAELNQQQLMEIVASEEVTMERGNLLPEIELFGNYNYNRQQNEVGFLQASRSFGPTFGLRVRFNLYRGGQDKTALQNAKITAATEELRSQKAGQDIEAAVRIAFLRWQNEMKQVRLESKSAAKAELTLQIASEQYKLRAIKDVDFREIQLNALRAKARLLQARYRAKSREIDLYRLSGQLMERIME